MKHEEKNESQTISKKLDVILGLLYTINESLTKKSTVKEKVKFFVNSGLSNKEISSVIGITEKYVSKEKALIKKGEKKNG